MVGDDLLEGRIVSVEGGGRATVVLPAFTRDQKFPGVLVARGLAPVAGDTCLVAAVDQAHMWIVALADGI